MRFSTFDQVAKHYAETTPLRGARASEDLRPIGQRRYWWRRIAKVNDNCYALCDGMGYWYQSQNPNDTEAYIKATAPIVWERKPDGDYLTIRNNWNDNISVGRYAFLQFHLPQGMGFTWDNGKHYVHNRGEAYYLPKFKANIDWQVKSFAITDDRKIVFKDANPDGFVRVSELQPFKTRRIDKELDKKYASKVTELWDWMQTVLPVLGDGMNSNKQQYAEVIGVNSYWYWARSITPDMAREILDNPDDGRRVALAVLSACEIEALALRSGRFQAHADSFQRLRKLMRRVAGLYAVEMR